MAQAIKYFLVPGSMPLLAIAAALGLAMLYGGQRLRYWGRACLTGLVMLYLALSTPIGAEMVSAPLSWSYAPLTSANQVRGVETIVALSTGSYVYRANGLEVDEMSPTTSYNAMETARVYGLLGSPTVLASGGIVTDGQQRDAEAVVLAAGLVQLGVPRDRIIVETRSRTTMEQAINSAGILRSRGTNRFVLVTGAEHMPRALSAFRAQGLDPVPSIAVVRYNTAPGWFFRFRPSLGAYLQSERACYEYLARLYYWGKALR